MADETYDAVIAGGGCKAMFLAMYLARYGGMSVGMFERRHEIGGGLAGEEAAAPGHLGNTHAQIIVPNMYYPPIYRDFPEFEGYGAKIDMYPCSIGATFANNETCLTIYSVKHDPTQERTAKEIARFSEADAERWLKLWSIRDAFDEVGMDNVFNPPERHSSPEILNRQMAIVPRLKEIGIEPEPITMQYSPIRAAREFWESKELQYIVVRMNESGAHDINQPGQGAGMMGSGALPYLGFARGGSHNIAHACHKVLLADGVKVWTHSEVEKVIIENGTAKGIRLSDGTEIGARKLVVSAGLSPEQLCFGLIGREYLSSKIIRRVELIETTWGTIAWYNWAVHEAPKYKSAAFNPDVNEVFWLGLAEDADVERIARAGYWKRLGMIPPTLEDHNIVVWCHSVVDPSYAPEGRHTCSHEEYIPHVTAWTEREWLEFKKTHAEDVQSIWQRHAPNMTWDNIIGYDGNTPYDHRRMLNTGPNGCMADVDPVPYQVGQFRPIPELANHRTPIKNLYATGGAWHVGRHAGSSEAYNCYKIIAEEQGLGKPWLEPGKEEPGSLVQEWKIREKRLVESAKAKV